MSRAAAVKQQVRRVLGDRATDRLARELRRWRPPPDAPPPDRPAVRYVRMLDGDRLWLGVPDGTAGLGLRSLPDGKLFRPPDEEGRRADGLTWVRWHLTDRVLPGDGDLELELVAAAAGRAAPAPVWVPPLPDTPTRTPESADGRWQFTLSRHPDGRLQVRRSAVPTRATLLALTTVPSGIELTCRAPGGATDLLLLDGATVRARLPMSATVHGTLVGVVSDADVPPEPGASFTVAIGTPSSHVPVVRRRNELRDPGVSTLMPKIYADADGEELVATRFSRTAELRLLRQPGR